MGKKEIKICDGCQVGPALEDYRRNNGSLTEYRGEHLCYNCLVGEDKKMTVDDLMESQSMTGCGLQEIQEENQKVYGMNLTVKEKKRFEKKMREMKISWTKAEAKAAMFQYVLTTRS